MNPQDIAPGQSYGCKFKLDTVLDELDNPVTDQKQTKHHAGIYTGFGVIRTRDLEQQLFLIVDLELGEEFVVPWQDTWDIDEIVTRAQ